MASPSSSPVSEVLDRLEDLFFCAENDADVEIDKEEKTSSWSDAVGDMLDHRDELGQSLIRVRDWTHNAYRRQEMVDGGHAIPMFVRALLVISTTMSSSSRSPRGASKMTAEQLNLATTTLLLLQILATFATHNVKAVVQMQEHGVVTVVTDLLGDFDNKLYRGVYDHGNDDSTPTSATTTLSSAIVTAAAWKLCSALAMDADAATTLWSETGRTRLPQTLSSSSSDSAPTVVAEAMTTLVNMTGHVALHADLVLGNNATPTTDTTVATTTTTTPFPILSAVIAAMDRHADDASVQAAACQVWWHVLAAARNTAVWQSTKSLASNGRRTSWPVHEVWHALRGWKRVTAALQGHLPAADVQQAGWGAVAVATRAGLVDENQNDDRDHAAATHLLALVQATLQAYTPSNALDVAGHYLLVTPDDDTAVADNQTVPTANFQVLERACRAAAAVCKACPAKCRDLIVSSSMERNEQQEEANGGGGHGDDNNNILASLHALASLALSKHANCDPASAASAPALAMAVLEVWGVLATCSLGRHSYEIVTYLVMEMGVVETTVAMLSLHGGGSPLRAQLLSHQTAAASAVADAACLVLWGVAQHYGKYVAACPGCEQAVEACLEAFGSETGVIRYGKRLQQRLAWKRRFGRR